MDVTDEASIAAAVAQLIARAGRIDVLINNAGFNPFGPLAEVPLADARRLFETNLLGPLALIQAVFPHMAARRSGRIVNVSSVVGVLPTPFAGVLLRQQGWRAHDERGPAHGGRALWYRRDRGATGCGALAHRGHANEGLERYARDTSLYRPVYEGIRRRAGASQDKPMTSEDFAREVSDAILADRPARIVRQGRGANLCPALSKLPALHGLTWNIACNTRATVANSASRGCADADTAR